MVREGGFVKMGGKRKKKRAISRFGIDGIILEHFSCQELRPSIGLAGVDSGNGGKEKRR